MIVVHNHEPRIVTIPGPYKAAPDATGLANEFQVTLKPGANDVHPDQWDQVKDYLTVKSLISAKKLEPEQFKAQSFDQLQTEDALRLVGQTLDRAKLQAWADSETRGKVKSAIAAQLKKLIVEQAKES